MAGTRYTVRLEGLRLNGEDGDGLPLRVWYAAVSHEVETSNGDQGTSQDGGADDSGAASWISTHLRGYKYGRVCAQRPGLDAGMVDAAAVPDASTVAPVAGANATTAVPMTTTTTAPPATTTAPATAAPANVSCPVGGHLYSPTFESCLPCNCPTCTVANDGGCDCGSALARPVGVDACSPDGSLSDQFPGAGADLGSLAAALCDHYSAEQEALGNQERSDGVVGGAYAYRFMREAAALVDDRTMDLVTATVWNGGSECRRVSVVASAVSVTGVPHRGEFFFFFSLS